jgi:hypothetical protein
MDTTGVSAKGYSRLKSLFWSGYLILVAALSSGLIFAPSLRSGERHDFILYSYLGITRGLALQLLLCPGIFWILYEILSVGINSTPGQSRILAVIRSAWADGSTISRRLFIEVPVPITRRELWTAIWLAAAFAMAFAVFLSQSLGWFKYLPDQHWAQAMVDYGLDWGEPVFSFGGNLLYGFGMQVPLKGPLLPMAALAHLFPIQFRTAATVVLVFLSAALLCWCLGVAIGLKLVYRIVLAGSVALIMTIPAGLSYVLWLIPPRFVTYNFTAVLFSGEATILCLFAAFAFFLIGQQRLLTTNLFACVGFAIGAFAPILSYPSASAYLIPILALYCFGFLMTCESRKEFFWKASVSAIVLTVMLIARVPEFILNLYSYGFAAYFFDFSPEAPASLANSSLLGFFIYYVQDLRGVFSILVALVALATAAYAAKGHLRRFAVAALVCEGGIIAVTTINLWLWRVPARGDYADLAHAPVWCSFLVLSIIIFAMLFDQRLVEWGDLTKSKYSGLIQRAIKSRRWAYVSVLVLAIAGSWLFQMQPGAPSNYPPRQTPLGDLLTDELALAPGLQFRGRLMTVVPADLKGPSNPPIFYDTIKAYRNYLGNDLWVDPLASNVPMLNEFGHFTSPFAFAFSRIFFGKEGDGYERATIVLSRFDLRIARLLGVKMVATDASTIPGGTLVYEGKAGGADLRIFHLDDVNLGQYSPTRTRYIRTATDAIAAIKDADFDPKLDVVVESEVSADLVPATSAHVTVDRGPALVVRATSQSLSLLVLPFEYSHCLEIKVTGGRAVLLPVNLLQIGLLFEKEVEARISYRFGLFQDARCRGDDLRRADNLKLKEALVRNNRGTVIHTQATF